MPRWRLLLTARATGAENMAVDEALMARARTTGEFVLRVYTWSAPTLSLGRNQSAQGAYDRASLSAAGVGVIRRPTGGRAVLHDREVTYSVTGPADGRPLPESYARINRLLVDGLRVLGIDASVALPSREPRPDFTPCFDRPSTGELIARGRKLVASAQWREDGAFLQHGSILMDGNQDLVTTLLRNPTRASVRPATAREILGYEPAVAAVAGALFSAVRDREDASASELVPDADLIAMIAALRRRYDDDAWTWRR